MRIGVIADTHIPQTMPALPPQVKRAFRNVDIILHAGDICTLATLEELEEITITIAVSGNRDEAMVRKYVEPTRIVEFANRKIGMTHGHRGFIVELREALGARLWGQPRYTRLYEHLLAQFSGVDCIVFGHTHQPYAKVHRGILLFNPGAATMRQNARPSVGVLNVTNKSISGRIIYL